MDFIAGERTFQKMTFPALMSQQMYLASSEKNSLQQSNLLMGLRDHCSVLRLRKNDSFCCLLKVWKLCLFVCTGEHYQQNGKCLRSFSIYYKYITIYHMGHVFFWYSFLVTDKIITVSFSGVTVMSVMSGNLLKQIFLCWQQVNTSGHKNHCNTELGQTSCSNEFFSKHLTFLLNIMQKSCDVTWYLLSCDNLILSFLSTQWNPYHLCAPVCCI